MLGSALGHFKSCVKQKGDVRQVIRHVIHYLLTVKLNSKVPMNVQEEAIVLLLKLSHYEPQDVIERLRIWYPKHTDTVSTDLRNKLELFVNVYKQRFPSLKKLFAKSSGT
ncbi:uncharacterized protein LOC135479630 [Liolophura sinensis]|uniref:uncharacterized protein LOC135479630 n=1 Tax=Liolophura sinensis TaxID=3198878 RepID=UPI003158BEF0